MPRSTIAALCYARDTEIEFDAVAAALSSHHWKTGGGDALDMPTRDFALCDVEGQRIGLARVALDRAFPGTPAGRHFPSCLLVSVGPDGTLPATATQPRHDRVLADLLLLLQEIAAADRVLMFERAAVFDSTVHDEVVDDLRSHLDKVLAPRDAGLSANRAANFAVPRAGVLAGAQADSTPPAAMPGRDTASATPVGRSPSRPEPRPEMRPEMRPASHPVSRPGAADRILPPAPSLVPPLAPSFAPSPAASTVEPDDIVQLAQRLETELDRLEDIRRALGEGDVANERQAPRPSGLSSGLQSRLRRGLPQGFPRLAPAASGLFAPKPAPKSAPKSAQARDSRPVTTYPDYEDMPANIDERPLLHRVAVNALNVTVMTIALPVGAALLTMSVLGREDMLTSSRVTAVTGLAVGLHNTGAASWVQSLFL